jgi:hypothetical protein
LEAAMFMTLRCLSRMSLFLSLWCCAMQRILLIDDVYTLLSFTSQSIGNVHQSSQSTLYQKKYSCDFRLLKYFYFHRKC